MSNEFLAGAGMCSLMPPPEAVNNALHANMMVRVDEQGSPLRAKALALTRGEVNGVLIALDFVYLLRSHCDVVRKEVAERLGLHPGDIVVSCSHSHSTPFAEPLEGPHPVFDFVCRQALAAAEAAWGARRPARLGHGRTHVVGASFNQRVPLPNGGVKFTRDFREGLATGRPIDPRLDLIRVDGEDGRPIAAWIRFATHPSCVIFNAPISAEYPGYMTDRLSETVAGGAPVLFGYGASGDVNCVPMFGTEDDSRKLGLQLAELTAPVYQGIETRPVGRFDARSREIHLPLDPPPPTDVLDREIEEVETFLRRLDDEPELEWVLDVNCVRTWPVEAKKGWAGPLAEWARNMKMALAAGGTFPQSWPTEATAWLLDELGLVFFGGEPFTELGLALAARSPLSETLLMAIGNGSDGYLGTDEDRRRGGYEMIHNVRYAKLKEGLRPLPYALGADEQFLRECLQLLDG